MSLEKNFCACERICTADLVPTCSSIFLHARPCSFSAAKNLSCSSSVHRSRCFVMVYGFRALGTCPTFATACCVALLVAAFDSAPRPRDVASPPGGVCPRAHGAAFDAGRAPCCTGGVGFIRATPGPNPPLAAAAWAYPGHAGGGFDMTRESSPKRARRFSGDALERGATGPRARRPMRAFLGKLRPQPEKIQ
eukprot:31221-Pelagococcus_subviridis.AAC.3